MQQALLDLHRGAAVLVGRAARRAHPRVARRIEIRFGQLDDLRAILEDISSGGLLMTVAEPLVLYEEIDVTVPDLGGGELLILHARVVNQRAVSRDETQHLPGRARVRRAPSRGAALPRRAPSRGGRSDLEPVALLELVVTLERRRVTSPCGPTVPRT